MLVAEDNAVNRMVLTEFLRAWGVKAVFAHDGEAALEILNFTAFDLVLVDRRMPKVDGEGVVKAIRERTDDKRNTPIIAVTADAMESDRSEMMAIGVDAVVAKPLKPANLKQEMASVLKASGAIPKAEPQQAG